MHEYIYLLCDYFSYTYSLSIKQYHQKRKKITTTAQQDLLNPDKPKSNNPQFLFCYGPTKKMHTLFRHSRSLETGVLLSFELLLAFMQK